METSLQRAETTRGPKQTKTKSETETNLQQAELLEALSKPKQRVRQRQANNE